MALDQTKEGSEIVSESTYHCFSVPSNWDEMTDQEQEAFCLEQAAAIMKPPTG